MQVPPASNQTWADLLTGKKAYQPVFLAARMLIVRCRMELVRAKDNPGKVAQLAAELRELYAKNAASSSANQDLTSLFG
jgi:hypothetical protein